MKKLFLLFPQKKWGEVVMCIGALSIVMAIALIGEPNKIHHFLLYFFSILIFSLGIIKHENFEPQKDSR